MPPLLHIISKENEELSILRVKNNSHIILVIH